MTRCMLGNVVISFMSQLWLIVFECQLPTENAVKCMWTERESHDHRPVTCSLLRLQPHFCLFSFVVFYIKLCTVRSRRFNE